MVRWGRRVMTDLWSKVKKKDDAEAWTKVSAPPTRPTSSDKRAKTEPFISRVPKNLAPSQSPAKGAGKSVDDSVLPSKSRFSFSMPSSKTERQKSVDDSAPTSSRISVLRKSAHVKAASSSSVDRKKRDSVIDDSLQVISQKCLEIPRLAEDRTYLFVLSLSPAAHELSLTLTPPTADAVHRLAEVPVWLLQTCLSLENLTSEYPRTMSVVGAILITIGSIPAIPAVSAGAAGAFLASTTAHALGSVALGLGSLITAQTVENSVSATNSDNEGTKGGKK